MGLTKYRAKRDLKRTPEPGGGQRKGTKGQLLFVVQRHKASHLHYDFRLEMRGVLKSWAVPKGPSMAPADKRLAMMVEDHPYDYKDFAGVIPEGNYGAGIVEIWDHGTYEPLEVPDGKDAETVLMHMLHKGSLKFRLKGRKLKGEFALVRMRTAGEKAARQALEAGACAADLSSLHLLGLLEDDDRLRIRSAHSEFSVVAIPPSPVVIVLVA